MDKRQVAESIMETLGLESLIRDLEEASIINGLDMLTMLRSCVASGIGAELYSARLIDENTLQRKKEKNQKKERNNNIYIKETKTKTTTLSSLNLDIQGKKSIPPLEAKRQAAEKKKKNVNKVSMPKAWVDARERETIDDQVLILYAEGQGYDWYAAKELFLAFVDHHTSKGSKFAKWESAFYTWIRNDVKWNGKPATQKGGSVVQSYESKNPIEDLFND